MTPRGGFASRTVSLPLPSRVASGRRTPLQLFAFDDRRGNREGTETDKVLGFYPAELPTDDQLGSVGLAQALVTFMSTFTDSGGSLHSLETERHWWAVQRFEPGVWFGMVVERLWGPGRLGDGACGALLEDVYAWVLLLHGTVNSLLERDPSGAGAQISVQDVLDMWGDRLLGARGKDRSEFESPLSLLRHRVIPALPLMRDASLAMQGVVGRLMAATHGNLKPVKGVLVCYDSFLLWSTLDAASTSTVFNYVTRMILSRSQSAHRRTSTVKIPSGDGGTLSCWLVTVTQGLLTFFLLIDEFAGGSGQVLNQVRAVMSSRSKQIAGAAASVLTNNGRFHISGYRYLVTDSAKSYGTVTPKKKLATLSKKSLALLTQAQAGAAAERHARANGGARCEEGLEIAVKGDSGTWVYIRTGSTKSLFVVLEQLPDAGLVEIGDHASKLCDKFFPGCFDL